MPGRNGWEKIRRNVGREYTGLSAARKDRITAGILRKEGWTPKRRKKHTGMGHHASKRMRRHKR